MTGNVFKHIAIAIEKTGHIHKHHLDACRILRGYLLKPAHVEGKESGGGGAKIQATIWSPSWLL